MNDDYKSLRGFGVVPSEILFNEDGFCIERQLYFLFSNSALSILLIFSSTTNLISAVNKGLYNWFFYLQVTFILLLLTFLIVIICQLFNYRKRNKKTYTYKDIKLFETSRKDVYINLTFEFSDNSKDNIKLYWNAKSRDLVTFLKTKVESSVQ